MNELHPALWYFDIGADCYKVTCVCGFQEFHETEDAAEREVAWHRERRGAA